MRKYAQISIFLGLFFLLVLVKNSRGDDERQPIVGTSQQSPASGSAQNVTNNTASANYKDGTYTGSIEDAFYGNIQVNVIISGKKITNIQFLQYPNDNRTSSMINEQAIPLLKQEAIQAQSSNVDIVSGASDSSAAFQKSLQNALQQAS